MNEHDTPEKNYDLERLLFFSDGVFAIAITLLVIEMRPPEHWDGTWNGLLMHILGKLIFYIISFFSLGLFWMAHRFIFRYTQKFDEVTAFLNLIFLCLIGLMPFVNAMASEHGMPSVVLQMYLGEMAAVSLTTGLMWFYIAFIARLANPRLTTGFKWYATARLTLMPLLIASGSLWIGMQFGILPSIAFLIVAFFVTNRLHLHPFEPDKAKPAA
ncbi:TMEM175 family protein [Asticcacaulis sp. 201]|uniref:TMEM175 family protein n=1 Tax=Asticcacaulis sp. 201 TaxID=3028787 RepID=UPI00291618DC|nr:TMEM175 family protein [Asticcacaulis sp. 201]MDV6331144.1 TMEM175 family protein [Asticcacaulis sp. 201]